MTIDVIGDLKGIDKERDEMKSQYSLFPREKNSRVSTLSGNE
jgi:hypothetical protein